MNILDLLHSRAFKVILKMTPALILAWFIRTPETFFSIIWNILTAYNGFPLLFLGCYFIVSKKKKIKFLLQKLRKKKYCAKLERDHVKEALNLPTREHAQVILDTLEDNDVIVRGEKNKKILNPLLGEFQVKRYHDSEETSHANSMQTAG